jgi:hypothetical protein
MNKNNIVEGMDISGNHDLSFCDECVYGKYHHTSKKFSKGSRAKEFFGLVHINVCGPMTIIIQGGAKYF